MKSRKLRILTAIISALTVFLASCGGDGGNNSSGKKAVEGFDVFKRVPASDPLTDDALPDFSDYFAPEGVDTSVTVPGGEKLPAIGTKAADGAPAFSEFSDLTYGDETIAITGDNLEGATVTLWAEGLLTDVKPLRTDNSKMQVTVPKEAGKSVMIVWPKNSNGVGAPIRINAPQIWWADAETLSPENAGGEIRLFGSALSLEGKTPVVLAVYESGEEEELTVKDANPYQIRASYPSKLTAGLRCKIYVHNGTGGKYGWSKAKMFSTETRTTLEEKDLEVINVDDFGAKAGDTEADDAAVYKAILKAQELGGGVIKFGKGEYTFSQIIEVTGEFPKGVVFAGAGEGTYDFKSALTPSEYEKRGLSGDYTSLRFADGAFLQQYMVKIGTNNVTFRDMTINGADDGMAKKFNVFASGQNITFNKVRFIKSDCRDLQTSPRADYVSTTNLEIDNYSKNIYVLDCEFHSRASAISIANIEGIWPWGYFDSSRTVKNVNVIGCDFYGYTSPYRSPKGRTPNGDEGEISRAVTAINLDGGVFENCTMQGYDRANNKLLVRSFYMGLPTKHTYIANNTMKNIGNNPGSGYDTNTGEQILFHGQDAIGAVFNATESTATTLTVTTENIETTKNGYDIKPADTTTADGSKVFDGFEEGDAAIIYVCAGKGAGQIRRVTSYDITNTSITFTLAEPFAIQPDSTSIVTLTAPVFENIIYHNSIGNDKPTLSKDLKTGGVLMFLESARTIIAENDIHNMAFGVSLNSTFKMPTVWTTVRDNKISGITEVAKNAAQGGDTTLDAAFLCDSVRGNAGERGGWDAYNIWYTIGNVFRNNDCSNGDVGGELVTNRWNLENPGLDSYYGEEKGNAMSIFENNTFKDVAQGITIGNPAYWSLVRNNTFTFKSKAGYTAAELVNYNPWTNFKLLYIAGDKVVRDDNKTVK